MKYADQFCDWLVDEGYTHCFFVAGGNSMHLLESASHRFSCVPFVHEVSAVIAAEYFNEARECEVKAFALVTAGPGVTNALTGIAGAYLESRSLLVVGGQVKSEDLSDAMTRQRGIQEVDGIALTSAITVASLRIERPISRSRVISVVRRANEHRKGPVFIEFCLDAQSARPTSDDSIPLMAKGQVVSSSETISEIVRTILEARRPIFLLGAGITRETARQTRDIAESVGVPTATSWNAADRVSADSPIFAGRPNTWGQRWANVLIQEADVIVALGARMGMQQTGFNWRQFAPHAQIIQVDLDPGEILKGQPKLSLGVVADANDSFLRILTQLDAALKQQPETQSAWMEWRRHTAFVRSILPLNDQENVTADGYVSPYNFAAWLSSEAGTRDVIVPCSSGGAFTVMMQAFEQTRDQIIITNKGLASMGYGLAGAMGTSIADPDRRVLLVEGDGGFAQNLQELGTAAAQRLNIKIFIFDNDGYASIRMTQCSYFNGRYVGCDGSTGLGLPDWGLLAAAYSIPWCRFNLSPAAGAQIMELMAINGPAIFLVPVDPAQTYFPKITSRITQFGSMESAPLHEMTPPMSPDVRAQIDASRPKGAVREPDRA